MLHALAFPSPLFSLALSLLAGAHPPTCFTVLSCAVFTGACYGAVHTLSGHPLDNIKAKLQLDVNYHGKSMWSAIRQMWGEGRARAFWRGCVPPLWVTRFPLRVSRAVCSVGLLVRCQRVLASIACDSVHCGLPGLSGLQIYHDVVLRGHIHLL